MIDYPLRNCDGCTKCCEGWLRGEAFGHSFRPGVPCFFKSESCCSIYEDRPEKPCKSYECSWKVENNVFPEWMKPNVSKVIVSRKVKNNTQYYEAVEAGNKMDSSALTFLIQMCQQRNINLVYQVDGIFYRFGSKEFLTMQF